ncbi:MAG: hypothetical protein AB1757_21620 [Acidobacteriota bacterium]
MTPPEHNKMLAIGFAIFAAIFTVTFLLLMAVSVGVFVILGIALAEESGEQKQAVIGVAGAIFTVLFYGVLGAICIVPTAMAAWRMFKQRPRARGWAIIASLILLLILPLGTMLGAYALWFLFSDEGKQFYAWLDGNPTFMNNPGSY